MSRWNEFLRDVTAALAIGWLVFTCAGCFLSPAKSAGGIGVKDRERTSAAGGQPLFSDITAAAGIHFLYQNSKTPNKYMVEAMGPGCAFIDYDRDGYLDILLLNGAPLPGGHVIGRPTLALYHNNHDGTFTDVTQQVGLDKTMYAMGVAVGDYDNDGYDDIYITCVLGPSHLYHNEGGRRFKDVTAQAGVANAGGWGTSCAWVDYDRDGKLDLFVCNYVKYRTLADDIPCYEGGKRVNCRPGNHDPSACKLYHNEGGGQFQDVSQRSGIGRAQGKSLGVAIWDYNHDGWPDIFVANDMTPGFLFHNNHDGTFTNVGAASGVAYTEDGQVHSGMGIDVDDMMNDGKAWVTITNFENQETSLYRQVTTDTFNDVRVPAHIATDTHNVTGFGSLFFDYDNDGWKDMAQVNGHIQQDVQERRPGTTYAQPTLLFHNQRDGTFAEVGQSSGSPFSDRIVGRGIAWGDIDNDGRLDLLITTNDGPAHLWRNVTAPRNHWLTLRLIGVKSNRDGIGAEVTVRAGGLTQTTLARSGSSYLSASDLRPHFGLGGQTKADVEIRWPSGMVDRIDNVPADHIWTVREGTRELH